jgi:hypothetical protein
MTTKMMTRKEKTRAAASLHLVLKNKKTDFDIACDMRKKRPLLFVQQVMIVYSVFFNFSQHLR